MTGAVRVLVTGADGLLGTTLVPTLAAQGHEVFCLSRRSVAGIRADLSNSADTARALDLVLPDVIVNLAALTNVDECERNPADAYRQNTLIVENLVGWIVRRVPACHLVQISTDQVYSGAGPHVEPRVCPINYYAFSKYAGELVAERAGGTVLRTNLFGRSRCPGRQSFSDWLVGVMKRGESVRVFEDVLFSPLSLETLASMIALSVQQKTGGIFNLGSANGLSKADFAIALGECLGLSTAQLVRARSTDAALAARRPLDMRMDSSRFESGFGVVLPALESEIRLMRNAYAS